MMISDTPVYREKTEFGAMLIRMAETHVRFGHFEHLSIPINWQSKVAGGQSHRVALC